MQLQLLIARELSPLAQASCRTRIEEKNNECFAEKTSFPAPSIQKIFYYILIIG
jgi:hypothetical protein